MLQRCDLQEFVRKLYGFALSAFILPVQVKHGSDGNAKKENETRRSNFVFHYLTKTKDEKTEMTIRILLSKVVEKPKTKTEARSPFSYFNVVGKRKTKTESRISFSDGAGKRKTKLEVRIPFF